MNYKLNHLPKRNKIDFIKKRLFIDSDILQKDELIRAQETLADYFEENGIDFIESVFDETKDFAWHEAAEAWEAVKRNDEIYGDTSLVPLCGYNTYTGAPVVMDVMMAKAIQENITGKSVYFLRSFENIEWDRIDLALGEKCFVENDLFTLEFGEDYFFKKVDFLNMP